MAPLRKLAALVAASALLAGCGMSGSKEPAEPAVGNSIKVWFPGVNPAEIELVTKTIAPAFEKETGAKVEVTFVDWAELAPKLNAAFAAGTAPDVFGHGPAAVADLVKNDRVAPLTANVAALSESDRKDLALAMPGGQVNGTQYLLPLSMQGNLIVYRAADFTEVGLDPDKPPTTWEDVRAAAEKLTKRDAGGKITRAGLLLPTNPIGLQQTFAALLGSAGGEQISADGKKVAFDSPAGRTALDYLTSLYDGPKAVSNKLGANYLDGPVAQQPIMTGDASMSMQTPNGIQQMVAANPQLDLRMMQPPKFEGAPAGTALGGPGPGLMINKDSKNQELGWKFIAYLISPDISTKYTQGIGAVPVRASAASSDYVQKSPVLQAFLQAMPSFKPNPNVPGWTQIRDTMAKNLEQAVNKQVDSGTALLQARTEVERILASAG